VTGIERPWLWSLPTRVELAEGAVIRFEEHGQTGLTFGQNQIDRMFEAGLMQPPRRTDQDPDVAAGVALDGDAKFLVGQVDLGREVGVEVLTRGLEAAVHAVAREYRDRSPKTQPGGEEHQDKPRGIQGQDARQWVMTVGGAADRWDELLPRVELWDRVVLTEDGRRVAVIVAWDWWTLHRHRQASLEGAYWGHWHTGEFNIGGYAWDILHLLEPRDARIRYAADESDGDEGDDGGADDQPG
jgi:hypothetical protein